MRASPKPSPFQTRFSRLELVSPVSNSVSSVSTSFRPCRTRFAYFKSRFARQWKNSVPTQKYWLLLKTNLEQNKIKIQMKLTQMLLLLELLLLLLELLLLLLPLVKLP